MVNMKGQSALAYLVMLAAILTIAVTSIIIFQSMLSPAQAANLVVEDKYQAGIAGMQLVEYEKPYTGALYAPTMAILEGNSYAVIEYDDHPMYHGSKLVDIGHNAYVGKFKMTLDPDGSIGLQSFQSRVCEIAVEDYDVPDKLVNTFCNNIDDLDTDSDLEEIDTAVTHAYSITPGLGTQLMAQ